MLPSRFGVATAPATPPSRGTNTPETVTASAFPVRDPYQGPAFEEQRVQPSNQNDDAYENQHSLETAGDGSNDKN